MPIRLFEEWRALYAMEPWGDERTDRAIGRLIAHLRAVHSESPTPIEELMPYLKSPEKKPQSESEMKAALNAVSETIKKQALSNE